MASNQVEIIDLTAEPMNDTITIEDSFVSDPFASDPVASDPSVSDLFASEPVASDPSVSDLFAPDSPPQATRVQKKQLDKLEKEATKANAATRKQMKLKQKELDRLQKEANRANAASKALDNCTAIIDENIIKIINDPEEISLRTLFDESMIKYNLSSYQKVENSVSWSLKQTEIVDGVCVPKYKDSKWIIVVMEGNDYLKRLLAYRENPDSMESIKVYLRSIKCRTHSDVILVVYNLASHLKSERMKDAKNYRKTFKDRFEGARDESSKGTPDDTSTPAAIGPTDLQDLRLTLEMELKLQNPDWKLHIEFHEKTSEVVQALVRYTMSIARLAVKQKARTSIGLDWAINMDKERAVDPTKSSEDLTKLWITQLQQFSQITVPIAKAIAAEYPSPCALLDQYENLTTSEAEDLLTKLYVQRNLKRQIGANISKRIHCFMTCKDPDVHIGLS